MLGHMLPRDHYRLPKTLASFSTNVPVAVAATVVFEIRDAKYLQ